MILTITANPAVDKRYVVENVRLGEVLRVNECTATIGGKGLNVAKVAKILGAEVAATGFVGGHLGKFITSGVEALGIENMFVELKGETRNCINIFDVSTGESTEFLEPGEPALEGDENKLLNLFHENIERFACVTISGSALRDISSDFYSKLIEIAKSNEKKVFLDTSGALLKNAVLAKPYMIKPNKDEIFQLTGKKVEDMEGIISAAKEIHQMGIEVVVVSMGEMGSLILSEEGLFRAIPPKILPVNTVGCGDSFVGAMAFSIEKGQSIVESAKIATAVSAAAALTKETGYFLNEDFKRLLPLVEIIEIK